jgi:hypothetical protein
MKGAGLRQQAPGLGREERLEGPPRWRAMRTHDSLKLSPVPAASTLTLP